jgi:urease accessory protein
MLQRLHSSFELNRAAGRIALTLANQGGRTKRERVHESGSLRVRFPNTSGGCEAVIVNTAGGMTGGDCFSIDFAVGDGASLVCSTAAAEKLYRSTGSNALVDVRLSVGTGARLAWMPQETILFDSARLARRIEADVAESGSLILAEAVVFGRSAMGESVRSGLLRDTRRVRIGGRLVFAENLRLDGAIADRLQKSAVGAGASAIATVLIAPADDSVLARLRACTFETEAGASAWNGIAVVRFCAREAAALRRDLIAALAVLGQSVPRLWLQ